MPGKNNHSTLGDFQEGELRKLLDELAAARLIPPEIDGPEKVLAAKRFVCPCCDGHGSIVEDDQQKEAPCCGLCHGEGRVSWDDGNKYITENSTGKDLKRAGLSK